jgi:hypothetical protein
MKLLLILFLLVTPLQATTEEPSMAVICDELLIELADAVDNGLLTHTESEEIGESCAILI